MTSAETTTSQATPVGTQRHAGSGLMMINLTSLPTDHMQIVLSRIGLAFGGEEVLVTTPDGVPGGLPIPGGVQLLSYMPPPQMREAWVPNAAVFTNLYRLAKENQVASCVLLGPESRTLEVEAIRGLATALEKGADLAMARYTLGPREGLFNSAMLYPVSRALYGAGVRYPLGVDFGMSLRMTERMSAAGQRSPTQADGLLWPVAEAVVAGYHVTEVAAGERMLPQPDTTDLTSILTQIAGSLFSDVEAKAAYWQRARTTSGVWPVQDATEEDQDGLADTQPMLASFRVAFTNLYEIWSLVLPPHSLLGLKKLSQMPAEEFRMSDALWARVVYDFILAYRMRTLNRGHLLGALTPLYLAWVASHLLIVRSGVAAERHVEEVAAAFETDKPYLVSRWRWPDRFNP